MLTHIPEEIALEHTIGFFIILAPAVHLRFFLLNSQRAKNQPVVNRQGGCDILGGVRSTCMMMVMLGREGNHMRQRPHGLTHPGPLVIVKVQIPVPVHVRLGCPQPLEGGRHQKDFHQAQIQAHQLKSVVGHDEPPGPAIHKRLGNGQLPLVILATGQMVRAMAHLVERLDPLQHPVLWAAAVGKQVK